jgi:RND family efflux transporter MFP subunit
MKLLVKIVCGFTAATLLAVVVLSAGCSRDGNADADASSTSDSTSNSSTNATVELSGDQLNSIKIGPVVTYAFPIEKTGIGTIDFQNNLYSDPGLSTQVFPPVAGNVTKIFVELGDEVSQDAPLYSIETADTNHSEVIVHSPHAGQVTSVNATVGLLVDPSNPPAPCAVADVSNKWLLANVYETDSTLFEIGQRVEVKVAAFPDQAFEGKITKVYPTVDPSTHRLTIRAEISDPTNNLRSGMFANFTVEVGKPVESLALPVNGIVREGDGTMTAWVTQDRQHFTQRVVKVGLSEDGQDQILEGLQAGELAVTDGAVFLDNMLQAPPSD